MNISALAASRHDRRAVVRRLIATYDLDAVGLWAEGEAQAPRLLQSALFDADEVLGWRAVEALGRAAAARRASGAGREAVDAPALEPVRELLRRVLWLMNEESGGLLWHGPQVIGSVLANVPALIDEFATILTGFLEEDPFRVGTRWALWRLAARRPDVAASAAPDLVASLADSVAAVRGHAALVLHDVHAIPAGVAERAREALAHDSAPLAVFDYRTGSLCRTTVAALACGGL